MSQPTAGTDHSTAPRLFFDSHCHLTDSRFAADLSAVLARAQAAGVAGIVTVASSAADSQSALRLAESHHDTLWCTAGIHPHEAAAATPDDWQALRDLVAHPRVAAIGETGLDYHYEHSPREVQRRLFRRHLELAAETGLPIVVHARDADEDLVAALAEAPSAVRGVLHCFTGGPQLLEAALTRGWYVSFSGLVSFKGFAAADAVRRVPQELLLIETDAPYLAPVPQRGRRNEPAFVIHVCEAAARIRDEPAADVAARTTENARRFYGLSLG
ncbi:MAG: TatD family hydrolase [Gemmatimonadetes bacterium]|nr:TatD family hydrolase [Gemmatimonadota bacterium]